MAELYEELGVSAAKLDVHAAIAGQDPGLFPNAFCKILPDALTGDSDYALVMHADGTGTKANVAYLYYKETGDPAVFRGIAQDSLVMNTDDLACVGAVNNVLVSNTIGRNAHRIGGDVLRELVEGYAGFVENMDAFGIRMALAGGETADIGDLTGTVVVDSTVIARIRRDAVVDAGNIRPGDAIVGLASDGQAIYESAFNSGIGSNGFTLARHGLLSGRYARHYPETYSSTLQPEQVYRGSYILTDFLPGGNGQTIGEALLSPTRTYLPVVKRVLEEAGASVTGIIHSSGGGQVKCRNFGKGLHYVKDELLPAPPIFRTIEEAARVPRDQMYETFNMGQRLEVYCDPGATDKIIGISRSLGVMAQIIGRVEASTGDSNQVTITDAQGMYTY